MESIFTGIGLLVSLPLLLGVAALLNGWALRMLWGWFIAPVFGLPVLTIAQSIGFAMIIAYVTYQQVDAQPKEEDPAHKIIVNLLTLVVRPLFSVFFGWIVHFFL